MGRVTLTRERAKAWMLMSWKVAAKQVTPVIKKLRKEKGREIPFLAIRDS